MCSVNEKTDAKLGHTLENSVLAGDSDKMYILPAFSAIDITITMVH
jgi:hypothetical protein